MRPGLKKIILWIFAGFVGLMLLLQIPASIIPPPDVSARVVVTPTKLDAYAMAKVVVTRTLKAPRSAHFPPFWEQEAHVTSQDDGTFLVRSYVDAHNTFGAMIRTAFTLVMQPLDNGDWRPIALEI